MVTLIISFCLKYSVKVCDIVVRRSGPAYIQLWNSGRTHLDRVLESLILHFSFVIFTCSQQLTLCLLFFTFWREDHFIVPYVPGILFILFAGTMLMWTCVIIFDRCTGWLATHRDAWIYGFWLIWSIWLVAVAIPMAGYTIGAFQFLWEILISGWLETVGSFGTRFQVACYYQAFAGLSFGVICVFDLIVILLGDIKSA